jgi:CDP-diacylglycerol--glycerol-3-phosphate 3-phosphatidyltransferase
MEKTKKKGMNLPNKITCARLIIAAILLVILVLPWDQMGVDWPVYNVYGTVNVDLLYLIAGGLFLIGSVSDFLDGYIARKYNLVTDFGKVTDAIADKVLVNGVLIILAFNSFIPLVVPVIIITRDIVVDAIKMQSGKKGKVVAASWPGKIKTICMMIGVTLTFFYDMPFAFIGNGIPIDQIFIYIATIMSIVSGCQYFMAYKDSFMGDM